MLVDTDVLIWYMRGHKHAADRLNALESMAVSIVTYIELVQGLRTKRELRALRLTFANLGISVLPLTETVSYKAAFLVEQHFHSHALRLADALIGATALGSGLGLLTANTKHYRVIDGLDVNRFRP